MHLVGPLSLWDQNCFIQAEQPPVGGRWGRLSVLSLELRTCGSVPGDSPLPHPGCVIFSGAAKGEG